MTYRPPLLTTCCVRARACLPVPQYFGPDPSQKGGELFAQMSAVSLSSAEKGTSSSRRGAVPLSLRDRGKQTLTTSGSSTDTVGSSGSSTRGSREYGDNELEDTEIHAFDSGSSSEDEQP